MIDETVKSGHSSDEYDLAFQVLVHRVPVSEGGGYWAEVPALPGCATQGETLDELYANVQDAIRGVMAVILEEEEGFPHEVPTVAEFVPTRDDFEMKIAV